MAITYDPLDDLYVRLKVDDGDEPAVIRAAYWALARELHTDVNPDPEVEERFKGITEAYGVLSDESSRKEYDEAKALYFGGLPPVLKLSEHTVDFGQAAHGDKSERTVLILNEGGDGICGMTAQSGRFWRLEAQAPSDDDPIDAVGKLVFVLVIDDDEAAGVLEEEIKVFLENDTTVSAQKLYLRVEVPEPTRPADPGHAAGRSAGTPASRTYPSRRLVSVRVSPNPSDWSLSVPEKICAWATAFVFVAFWGQGIFDWPVPLLASARFLQIMRALLSMPLSGYIGLIALIAIVLTGLQVKGIAAFEAAGKICLGICLLAFVYAKLTVMTAWWVARAIRAAYVYIRSS